MIHRTLREKADRWPTHYRQPVHTSEEHTASVFTHCIEFVDPTNTRHRTTQKHVRCVRIHHEGGEEVSHSCPFFIGSDCRRKAVGIQSSTGKQIHRQRMVHIEYEHVRGQSSSVLVSYSCSLAPQYIGRGLGIHRARIRNT